MLDAEANYEKITSVERLKDIADNTSVEIFIYLNGFRSSKTITYYPEDDSWYLFNEIDDTDDDYCSTEKFQKEFPFFFEALEGGAVYKY